MKVILENVDVYETWSLVAVERNVLRQISKAMCTFQPPSTKRNSLDFRLEQKPHFLMKIGIVERTAPSGLYAEDPEIKIARETAMFYAISNASLYLLMARPRCAYCGVLHSSPVIALDPTVVLVQLGRTGMLLSLVRTGSQRSPKTEDVPQMNPSGAWGCSIPASLHGIWASRALWPEPSTLHSTGMAQLAQSIRTTVVVVRTSSSMLTRHVHKSSRHRMPLWSVFRARFLAGLNQHNCSGICGVMQI